MFNHVEGEVVEPAETPDRQRKQRSHFDCGRLKQQEQRCENSQPEKQNALQFDPARIGEVFHTSYFISGGNDCHPERFAAVPASAFVGLRTLG